MQIIKLAVFRCWVCLDINCCWFNTVCFGLYRSSSDLFCNVVTFFGFVYRTYCGCETWSVTLRKERRLRVFENGVLRRMFDLKRDEVTEEWIKLYNEELNDLYYSPNIFRVIKSRRMWWSGDIARMGERRGEAYTGFWWGKPVGKRPLGRPRWRWKDNIKMDLQEVGFLGYGLD